LSAAAGRSPRRFAAAVTLSAPTEKSANPKPPLFRLLRETYPLSNLEEALSEGIVVGHEGEQMPPFAFSARQIEALLAYLASVQRK
jgi:cytochrome c